MYFYNAIQVWECDKVLLISYKPENSAKHAQTISTVR